MYLVGYFVPKTKLCTTAFGEATLLASRHSVVEWDTNWEE